LKLTVNFNVKGPAPPLSPELRSAPGGYRYILHVVKTLCSRPALEVTNSNSYQWRLGGDGILRHILWYFIMSFVPFFSSEHETSRVTS
jgi:hypothetical protein